MDTAIRARRVVTPAGERAAVVVIRDGRIAEVADSAPSGCTVTTSLTTESCCPAWSTRTCT